MRTKIIALLAFTIPNGFAFIFSNGGLTQQGRRTRSLTCRSAAALSECFASNEFSRLIDPERVLKIGSSSASNRNRREYRMALEASEEECQALAKRFDLPALDRLQAEDVVLRPASGTSGVEVEGSICATLTQRCVRTNEDFSVSVEFPLYAIVRPVVALHVGGVNNDDDGDDDDAGGMESDEDLYAASMDDKAAPRRNKAPPNLETLDVFQLQQLMQDFDEDDELANVLMEDQAIYPVGGHMDVGELVAQLFWLQLDPYPKKPGSEPVQRTISG
eukprot:scaffold11172_cov172-Amphora_coffeaeformis.AAC.3